MKANGKKAPRKFQFQEASTMRSGENPLDSNPCWYFVELITSSIYTCQCEVLGKNRWRHPAYHVTNRPENMVVQLSRGAAWRHHKKKCLKIHQSFVTCLMILCIFFQVGEAILPSEIWKKTCIILDICGWSLIHLQPWTNLEQHVSRNGLQRIGVCHPLLGLPSVLRRSAGLAGCIGVFWMPIPWLSVTFHWSQEYQTRDIPGDLYNVSY